MTEQPFRAVGREQRVALLLLRSVLYGTIAALALFLLLSTLRDNPIQVERRVRSISMAFLPQGWAFFTRDPREEDRLVYRRSVGKLTAINDRGRGGFETLFGIRRTPRLVQIELMALLETLPAGVWQPCRTTDRPLECVRGIEPLKLRNRSKLNLVCGEFLVVNRPPAPWAWAGSSTAMPGSVLAFDAECSS